MQHKQKVNFIVSVVFFTLLVALYYFSIKYALPFLMPFFTALIIGALLQRPINFFAKKTKLNRRVWSGIVTAVFFLTIGTGVAFIIYYIVRSIESIVLSIPEYITTISDDLSSATEGTFSKMIAFLPDQIENGIIDFMQQLSDDFSATLQSLVINYYSDIAGIVTQGEWAKQL